MRETLRAGLTAAIKARDRTAIAALRSALAAIDNAGAVPQEPSSGTVPGTEHVAGSAIGVGTSEVAPRHLGDAELRSIVEQEVYERLAAAAQYDQLGNGDAAARLRAEAEVLSGHLRPAT